MQSTERLNSGIAYCEAWFDSFIILIERIEPVGQDETKVEVVQLVMRPLNSAVWAVTAATVVASALVYQFLEHLGGRREERSWRRWFMDNLYLSSINFTQNFTYEPPTLAGRILGVSFAFWTMGTALLCACLTHLLGRNAAEPLTRMISRPCVWHLSFLCRYWCHLYCQLGVVTGRRTTATTHYDRY